MASNNLSTNGGKKSSARRSPRRSSSKTAPARLEGFEDESDDALFKKLAKSQEEDFAGNYFKPGTRSTRILAQAQETQAALSKPNSTNSVHNNSYLSTGGSNLNSNPNMSSSFNSGLNTFGLNNSYTGGPTTGMTNGTNNGHTRTSPLSNGWGGGGGQQSIGGGTTSIGAPYSNDLGGFRKPSRLEALPSVGRLDRNRKKSGPMLNTMGTF